MDEINRQMQTRSRNLFTTGEYLGSSMQNYSMGISNRLRSVPRFSTNRILSITKSRVLANKNVSGHPKSSSELGGITYWRDVPFMKFYEIPMVYEAPQLLESAFVCVYTQCQQMVKDWSLLKSQTHKKSIKTERKSNLLDIFAAVWWFFGFKIDQSFKNMVFRWTP